MSYRVELNLYGVYEHSIQIRPRFFPPNTISFPIDEGTGKVAAQGSSIVPAGHSGEAQTQDPVIQILAPLTRGYPLPCS